MRIARKNTDLLSNNFKLEIKKWWVAIHTKIPQCT